MAQLGILSVNVEFSGAGDSGEIESIDLNYMAFSNESKAEDFQKNHDEVAVVPEEVEERLTELVGNLSDSILEGSEVPDWYNNEGGHGTLVWNPATKTIEVEVNERVIGYETTHLTYDANGVEVD